MSNYRTLNLPDSASKEDVKKAYRKLSKIYHPDVNGGDEKKTAHFVKIKEAYELILKGDSGIKVNKTNGYTRNSNLTESFEAINGFFNKNGDFVFIIKTSYIQKIYLANNLYPSNIYFDHCGWDLDRPKYDEVEMTIRKKFLKKENYIIKLRLVGWTTGNITYKTFKIKKPKRTIIDKVIDYVSSIF